MTDKNFFNFGNLKSSDGKLIDLYLSNYDLELFFLNYEIYELYYIDGYMYSSTDLLFKDFVKKFYKLKQNEKNKTKKNFYKLILNSLFGRINTKKNIIKKEPVLKNKNIILKMSNEIIKSDGGYLPVGVFITSISRYLLLTDIFKIKNDFIYCDTDSIHFFNFENIKNFKISKKLGNYKLEFKNSKAKYIKLKTYIISDGKKTKKVIAGIQQEFLKNINLKNLNNNSKIKIKRKILDKKNNIYKYKNFNIKI